MDIAYFPNAIANNGHHVLEAMISALQDRGHRMVANTMSADAAVIWSVLWTGRMRQNQTVFEHYLGLDKNVLILEVGCLRRGSLWKIGVNGTLPRHVLCNSRYVDRRRDLGITMSPWRRQRGNHILVCLQRTQSWQWQSMPDVNVWLEQIIDEIRQHSDRQIVVRPHPRQRIRSLPVGCELWQPRLIADSYDDFDLIPVLDQAWAVINHNSHPGVQSVIQGVPAFVGSNSLAADVGNSDFGLIENPKMPDREAWFDDLVWTEFTVDEIRRGVPLDNLSFA